MRACAHCGTMVTAEGLAEPVFCCLGCETVYGLLRTAGLDSYYQLRQDGAAAGQFLRPWKEQTAGAYDWLDSEEILARYAPDRTTMEFYLEGVHCTACLWLLENLPRLDPSIAEARLNLTRSVLRVRRTPEGRFSKIASLIRGLGYLPHPLAGASGLHELRERESRRDLTRIGVAAAATGNIMLMAVSNYAGAPSPWKEFFELIMLLLAIPVLGYSALPFYRASWGALKSGGVSIDVPIAAALVAGCIVSVYNLAAGNGHGVYFDSLGMLVTLVLSSRYLLKRIQQKAVPDSHLVPFALTQSVRVLRGQELAYSPADQVHPGSVVEVRAGERVPVDGRLLGESALLDLSVLTGEPFPQTARKHDAVFAGSRLLQGVARLETTASGEATRIGQLLHDIESGEFKRAPILRFADRVGQRFTAAVLLASVLLFAYYASLSDWETAFDRALALIIVTCPCVFAFAIPLATGLTLAGAARRGILVKSAETLERLNRTKAVALDKTGTLTQGQLDVTKIELEADAPIRLSELEPLLHALESRSRHPIARAICAHLEAKHPGLASHPLALEAVEEHLGQGVSGTYDGVRYQVRGLETADSALALEVGLFHGEWLLARIRLEDQLRPDTSECLGQLRERGLRLRILSGDRTPRVRALADTLQIQEAYGELLPEAKAALVQGAEQTLMVGDGANDAAALQSAFIGVAVEGSLEESLRSSDVYFAERGLRPLVALFDLAKETYKIIHRNLILSISYNTVAAALVVAGHLNPLSAAVLMPLSSLTVLASSFAGTSKLRELLKGHP